MWGAARSDGAVWEWQSSSGWTPYDTRQQNAFNAAYDRGDAEYRYSATLKGQTVTLRIVFDEMKQYTGPHKCRNIRRIDEDDDDGHTPRLPKLGAHPRHRLIAPVDGDSWEWLSDGGWQAYPDDVVDDLNAAKRAGDEEITVRIGGTDVTIDLVKGVQRTGPHKSRPVRFVQVSTAAGHVVPRGPGHAAAAADSVLATPKHWRPRKSNLDKFNVDVNSAEAKKVLRAFQQTVSRTVRIHTLIRVQNYALWGFYALLKKHIEKQNSGNANQKKLFHGCRTKDNMNAITNNGFDMRVAASGSIGIGIYFAEQAAYSDGGYALVNTDGTRELFITRVLCGKTCPGANGLRRPPPINPSKPNGALYDSVNAPGMYVVFDNKQAYPEYIVKYT